MHWKDWSWSWNSNTLATSCKELTYWKRPWCWEGLRAGGEGDDRGWDGWMASPTRLTWVWVNSGSWWWTGRPGVLWFMGLQRVRHNWAIELNWITLSLERKLVKILLKYYLISITTNSSSYGHYNVDPQLLAQLPNLMESTLRKIWGCCPRLLKYYSKLAFRSIQVSSLAQSCLTICDPMKLALKGPKIIIPDDSPQEKESFRDH